MSEASRSGTPVDVPLPPASALPLDGGAAGARKSLSGQMGTSALALTVLAFSAPISVVSGFIPFTILFDGTGAAFGFLTVTVVLLLFAAGYVTMTKHVPKPGDFYSFISTGLGKVPGLGAAFLAVTAYLVMLAGVYAQLGVVVSSLITSFHGPATSWWPWSVAGWLIVSVLGHFHVELSAKLLSAAMVLEVAVVLIYDFAVLVRGGSGGSAGLSLAPLSPAEFLKGDVGVTLLFGVLVFLGFESTALYRDEVRRPNRTIPRATYIAVVFVGVLYTLSCYALTTAYGPKAVGVATASPASMFPDSIGHYVAPVFTQLSYLFVTTSVLAALLSIHNVLARYLHNLGYDRAIPVYFAGVHERHSSPFRASALAAALCAAVLGMFVLAGKDGVTLYAELTGLASVGVLVLMTFVSLAVIVWFARKGVPAGESLFTTFAAPGLACLALAGTTVLALLKFNLVVGGETPGQNMWLVSIPLAGLAVGLALAVFYKSRRRHIFDGLGRDTRVVDLTVDV
ncbi:MULTISPECIES: APC family permease [Streptomyces]|uniref:APC family permease n=1 Tax=Streptomyces lycopersici TaxID=2974589 RepID=UPI0021D02B42|nr:APC family permease [Streptomyces sp. NEAU-383]